MALALAPLSQTLLITVPSGGASPTLTDRVTIPVVVPSLTNTRANSTRVRANASGFSSALLAVQQQIVALETN